jgi:hypothetical protein
MGLFLTTVLQRATELRSGARHLSTDTFRDLWQQAPYLTLAAGATGIAAAIEVSKQVPAPTRLIGTPGRPAPGTEAQPAETAAAIAPTRIDAVRRQAIGVAIALVLVVVAASQVVERLINRFLRPDTQEWTWIGDLVLSVGLLVMTTYGRD